ncbi:beta-lactamase family protein [Opitutia bacterium ISCC 51]|nr:beta-lactamase family protein [Opitutae bacterium ISCC 51]QXD30055.1 beta-lactamase family protein [Opitutae bacterium ISCC 52]
MIRSTFFLLVLCWLPIAGFAQTKSAQVSPPLREASPESVGMSSERLERIDAMAKSAIENNDVPGLVAIVARNGKIVFHKAYGESEVATGRGLKTDDIFRIASQTKAITATAVMMLWEEGHFRLDDPISKWIPEFKNPQVLDNYNYTKGTYTTITAKRDITIRHLLTHSSGIGYGFIDGDERMKLIFKKAGIVDGWTTEPSTNEQNIKKLAKLPLHFHPGDQYKYAEGLDVLAYLVEIISGVSFAEFLETRLFNPIGMKDTYFYLPESKIDRMVTVHKREGDQWVKYTGRPEYYDADYPIIGARSHFGGGGGLSSTALDYATFLQMYLNGGELNGIRILSRTTIDTMNAFQVELKDNVHYGLAFGVVNENGVSKGGEGSEGTFSWGGYFNSSYFADPNEQVLGVILKQTRGPTSDKTGWQFKQLVFQAIDD